MAVPNGRGHPQLYKHTINERIFPEEDDSPGPVEVGEPSIREVRPNVLESSMQVGLLATT